MISSMIYLYFPCLPKRLSAWLLSQFHPQLLPSETGVNYTILTPYVSRNWVDFWLELRQQDVMRELLKEQANLKSF